ncbi:MAG: hypothetical protein ACOCP8_04295 [archaeon]
MNPDIKKEIEEIKEWIDNLDERIKNISETMKTQSKINRDLYDAISDVSSMDKEDEEFLKPNDLEDFELRITRKIKNFVNSFVKEELEKKYDDLKSNSQKTYDVSKKYKENLSKNNSLDDESKEDMKRLKRSKDEAKKLLRQHFS